MPPAQQGEAYPQHNMQLIINGTIFLATTLDDSQARDVIHAAQRHIIEPLHATATSIEVQPLQGLMLVKYADTVTATVYEYPLRAERMVNLIRSIRQVIPGHFKNLEIAAFISQHLATP